MMSSIPSSFDPLGSLHFHPFPLPTSLTDGLIDAAIQGFSLSYNNFNVTPSMTMDSSEVAELLLETQSLIVKIGSANKQSNVVISNNLHSIDSQAIPSGILYNGYYLYNDTNRRQVTGNFLFPLGVYAVNHVNNDNTQCNLVVDDRQFTSSYFQYSQTSKNKVSFNNVSMVFFYDYVMSIDEMKAKSAVVRSLKFS